MTIVPNSKKNIENKVRIDYEEMKEIIVNEILSKKDDYTSDIAKHQRMVTRTLVVQYVIFALLMKWALYEGSVDHVSEYAAVFITLGVLGIGIARWKTDKITRFNSDAYLGGKISEAKIISLIQKKNDGTKDIPQDTLSLHKNFIELGALLPITKDSLQRLERSTSILWTSELFFIAFGTL